MPFETALMQRASYMLFTSKISLLLTLVLGWTSRTSVTMISHSQHDITITQVVK